MFRLWKKKDGAEDTKAGSADKGEAYQIPVLHRVEFELTPELEKEFRRREQEEWLRSQIDK